MRRLVVIAFLIGFVPVIQAQQVTATLDTDSIRMGEPAYLSIRVCVDLGKDSLTVLWPEWPKQLAPGVEVLLPDTQRTFLPNPTENPLYSCQEQVLKITLFDTGFVPIPPITLSTTAGPIETNPLLLHSRGPVVDMTSTFKDVKPPMAITYNWWAENWMWVVIVLIAATGIFFLFRRFLLRGPEPIELPKEPTVEVALPHVLAFEQLEALQQEQLWQRGKVKTYHSRLNSIFREYLEKRYRIQALEETTDEIVTSMRNRGMAPSHYERVESAMRMADLVKFAKAKPTGADNQEAFDAIYSFIEFTRQEAVHS